MPTYNFIDNENGIYYSHFLSINSLEEYLKSNPKVTQLPSSPAIVSGRGMGKPDDSFRDILRNIKHEHSRGTTQSTVNTF